MPRKRIRQRKVTRAYLEGQMNKIRERMKDLPFYAPKEDMSKLEREYQAVENKWSEMLNTERRYK